MQGHPDDDALLTPSEVAAMFRVNPKTVTRWARAGSIILCLLIASANFLWFVDSYDKEIPRFILVGTGLATFLAVVGAYLLLFRWPACPDQES